MINNSTNWKGEKKQIENRFKTFTTAIDKGVNLKSKNLEIDISVIHNPSTYISTAKEAKILGKKLTNIECKISP